MSKAKQYTYKDTFNATLDYFNGDTLATSVWMSKYALKEMGDGNDDLEKATFYEKEPDDMFHRISNELHRAGLKYNNPLSKNEIFNLIKDFKYVVPQGRPMAGIGNDNYITSLSNCFVVGYPDEDSYGSIFRTDQEIGQLEKRGGGVGTDLSHFRASGSKVRNAAQTSTGPVEICANRFSNTTREVGQSGRRGALMLSMDINHKNAEEFMDSKLDRNKITGANISLRINDKWLESFIDNDKPDEENERLWKKIILNAWKSAEPGVLFWDTIINESVADCYSDFGFKTISTNPCGEINLSAYDSCRLMLLNLYSYVINPFTKEARIDWDLLADHARKITKIMDNMIDLEIEKINNILEKVKSDPESDETKEIEINLWDKIRHFAELGRRAGIGITGEGDMLAALGLKYGTKEATDMAEEVHKLISTNVYIESCDLVQRDGRHPFGVFNPKLEESNPFINRLISQGDKYSIELKEKIRKGRRNISLLTIAPAGSVSILTKTTSGIEPVFKPFYDRKRKIDKNGSQKPDFIDETGDWFQTYTVTHHNYAVWYSVYKGITYNEASEELSSMGEADLLKVYEESPYYGATSNDIDWVEKVNMQGRVQKWVDHSISATTNIPKSASVDVVRAIYETAWKSGCKGMTIYRDGSRDGVLTTTNKENKVTPPPEVKRRPKTLPAKVVRFNNNGEKWVSVIGLLEDKPYEIFTGRLNELNIPKYVEDGFIVKNREIVLEIDELNNEVEISQSRYDFQYNNKEGEDILVYGLSKVFNEEYWDYAKLISGLLRHNMAIEYVVKVISSLKLGGDNIGTWKNGVVRALRKFMKNDVKTGEKCPMCNGDNMVNDSGCSTCMDCGYSKCN